MKLYDYKLIFIVIGLIGVLFIALPAFANIFRPPNVEQLSELYLLGPSHMTENYPFNITVGESYSIYVGIINNMGSSCYYVLYVKLMNGSDLLPDHTAGTPSPVQPLYEYRFSIENGQSWESPLTFAISNVFMSNNQSTIGNFSVNYDNFNVNKPTVWNSTTLEFQYTLLFELWLFNPQSESLEFNNRFVYLRLNNIETIT